jgi:hypothetical protein
VELLGARAGAQWGQGAFGVAEDNRVAMVGRQLHRLS